MDHSITGLIDCPSAHSPTRTDRPTSRVCGRGWRWRLAAAASGAVAEAGARSAVIGRPNAAARGGARVHRCVLSASAQIAWGIWSRHCAQSCSKRASTTSSLARSMARF